MDEQIKETLKIAQKQIGKDLFFINVSKYSLKQSNLLFLVVFEAVPQYRRLFTFPMFTFCFNIQ